jgi:hypothetical protein
MVPHNAFHTEENMPRVQNPQTSTQEPNDYQDKPDVQRQDNRTDVETTQEPDEAKQGRKPNTSQEEK